MKERIMNSGIVRWAVNLKISKWAASNPVLSKFCTYEIISYIICGVLTTIVNYVAYFIARALTGSLSEGASILISQCASWILAVLFAYFVNKAFVFLSDDWSSNTIKRELPPFIGCRLFSFFTDTLFMLLTVKLLHLNEPLMKIVSNVFVMIINYFGSKLLVFKKKD